MTTNYAPVARSPHGKGPRSRKAALRRIRRQEREETRRRQREAVRRYRRRDDEE